MSSFKIQGVGLDTSNIKFNPENMFENEVFGYVYTSIPANNDFLISNFINNILGEPPLIVYTDSLDNLEINLLSHLSILKKSKADLLLVDSKKADWNFVNNLENLMVNKIVSHIGITNLDNVEDLKTKEELLKKVNIEIEFVSTNICPLEFDLELIDYCNEKKYQIIGTNPFGGYVSAPRNINMFSVPYLLGFCANYSDIVLVSGRNLFTAVSNKNYLSELIGMESNSGYILKKSTKKPVKELKKAVYTSIKLEGLDVEVPYEDPEQIISTFDFRYKIGSYKLDNTEEVEASDIDKITDIIDKTTNIKFSKDIGNDIEIENYLKIIYYPSDGSLGTKLATARYKALEYLNNLYPSTDGWNINLIKIGSTFLMISVHKDPEIKGHFIWKHIEEGITRQYYLIVPIDLKKSIEFKEVKVSKNEENSSEKE